MTYTPAAIENGIPGYYEIHNSDGMNIGNAITNDSPFEGCKPVTIEDAERNAKLWCTANELLETLEAASYFISVYLSKHQGMIGEEWEGAMGAGVQQMNSIINKTKGL